MLPVDATPNEKLADESRKNMKNAGLKIRVVEKSGMSVKRSETKSNLFRKQLCSCEVCKQFPNLKLNCKQRDVFHKIKCQGKRESN